MAINPNPSLPNRNTLYLGRSGSGKSQALLQRSGIPSRGARVLLLDPNHDHPCHRIPDKAQFARTVAAALKSGKGFRLALDVPPSEEAIEFFARVVLASLDGKGPLTFVLIEEITLFARNPAQAPPNVAAMLNTGRKFGMVLHGTTQRPQNISKDFFEQCAIRWVGAQKTAGQRKKLAEEIGVTADQLAALRPLEFYHDKDDGSPPALVRLAYQKPPHL